MTGMCREEIIDKPKARHTEEFCYEEVAPTQQ